jgi:hypothetical protein
MISPPAFYGKPERAWAKCYHRRAEAALSSVASGAFLRAYFIYYE